MLFIQHLQNGNLFELVISSVKNTVSLREVKLEFECFGLDRLAKFVLGGNAEGECGLFNLYFYFFIRIRNLCTVLIDIVSKDFGTIVLRWHHVELQVEKVVFFVEREGKIEQYSNFVRFAKHFHQFLVLKVDLGLVLFDVVAFFRIGRGRGRSDIILSSDHDVFALGTSTHGLMHQLDVVALVVDDLAPYSREIGGIIDFVFGL